jgi:hypothetical protein
MKELSSNPIGGADCGCPVSQKLIHNDDVILFRCVLIECTSLEPRNLSFSLVKFRGKKAISGLYEPSTLQKFI